MSNSKVKVKGLLKGLRYISQIFENEKEGEMQIGHPTDVKHVAHIGWDGPSVNSPCLMNEFKGTPSFSSPPNLTLPAASPPNIKQDVSLKWVSQDGSRRGGKGSKSATSCSLLDMPRSSSRRLPTVVSPTGRERSERQKARRSSKSKESSDKKQTNNVDSTCSFSLPDISRAAGREKKTGRSKGSQVGDTYKSPFSDPGSVSISVISKETGLCHTP